MKFGFKLSIHGQAPGTPFRDLIDLAVRSEGAGFDGVYVVDHLLLPGSRLEGYTNAPSDKPSFLDAWTSLAAIAQATSTVRIGPQVTPIGLRHPVFVAKWAATVDQISEGRLLLQIGAGHQKVEYDSYGFEYPNLAQRVERLREGILVIRELWESESVASFQGEHYVLKDVPFFPKPVQKRPEIWLGGGSARVRSLVAELADGWTPAAPQGDGLTPETFAAAMADLRGQVTDGRHRTAAALFYAIVTDDPDEIERGLGMLRRREDWAGYDVDEFRRRAIVLAGSANQIVDYIKEYEAAGLEHISLAFLPIDDLEATRRMIDVVGRDVIPHFS
ncbi:MAG TPA: LLM class flavin-dependent oxidoreductase [Pseudolysinimonas sp.]|nr:LLM class flavin-dependent oxidoreductase [Pseudolysinimonas sp.]